MVGPRLRQHLPRLEAVGGGARGLHDCRRGFEIMINCDFAIAAEDAKIGDFHIRRARSAAPGRSTACPHHRRAQGEGAMLTGKLLSGREAYEWGLVNACAPAEELDACVDRFVADLVDKSPFQMAITKMCRTAASTPTPTR